jgi:hypothetical protein
MPTSFLCPDASPLWIPYAFREQNIAAVQTSDRVNPGAKMALSLRDEQPPEPSPKTSRSRFIIGQDPQGHWIAMDSAGREGGFFVSQKAALKYVAAETGRRRGAARFSTKPLCLWK